VDLVVTLEPVERTQFVSNEEIVFIIGEASNI
jgi:hypothetical protein